MFPGQVADHPAVPLIKQLLNRQPYRRGTPSSLKKHEWFESMNWEDLYYRALQPAYTPNIEPTDTMNPMNETVQAILRNDELLEPIRGRHQYTNSWDVNF